jgi:alpha-glucosidase
MNDPATGFSALAEMRFEQGAVPHDRYHNQYAHLMAKASAAAFERLAPDGRPFLLTRSGFTGTQRYSAVWTGDNVSRWAHLRMALPMTLNLGLSGLPFTGPDVGGFMGHTTAELLVRWYQAGFLFPFFRNHSGRDSKPQEPWQFGAQPLACIRAAIVNRYRLLPYLYTCFFEHWRYGDPVLRPLLYEYDDPAFDSLDDQFLLGDALLVAPILYGAGQGREVVVDGECQQLRHITLPPGWWFDLNRGEWLAGGRTVLYPAGLAELPWFVRDGAMLPWYAGPLGNDAPKLDRLELHIFSRERPAALDYYVDDQASRAYQRGHYNTVRISAELGDGEVRLAVVESGPYPAGTVTFRPVLYGRTGSWRVKVSDGQGSWQFELVAATREWLGKALPVLA